MNVREIVRAMLNQDVSAQEFLEFFASLGLQNDSTVRETHYELLTRDTLAGPPVPWSIEDADAALDALRSPDVTLNDVAEFEPWSPRTETLASAIDEFEPWSPRTETAVADLAERRRDRVRVDSQIAGPSGMQQNGGADDQEMQPPYRIELSGVRRFARATASESTYRVRFNDQWQGRRLMDLRQQLYRMFEEVLQRARMGLEDNDLVRVIIRHDALNHAVVIPLREVGDADVETILKKIENVLQSDETLSIDDSFRGNACVFFSIRLPHTSHERSV